MTGRLKHSTSLGLRDSKCLQQEGGAAALCPGRAAPGWLPALMLAQQHCLPVRNIYIISDDRIGECPSVSNGVSAPGDSDTKLARDGLQVTPPACVAHAGAAAGQALLAYTTDEAKP